METKIETQYVDQGFGFPVKLDTVEMVKIRGIWTPRINYADLARITVSNLVNQNQLTGCEVKFIRHYFKKTQLEFSEIFESSPSEVSHWETQDVVDAHIQHKIQSFIADYLNKCLEEDNTTIEMSSIRMFLETPCTTSL